jgi:hypothetical protein
MPKAARPRLGGISFLHRFGSALNHHVHLHACVTDGVFLPAHSSLGYQTPSGSFRMTASTSSGNWSVTVVTGRLLQASIDTF